MAEPVAKCRYCGGDIYPGMNVMAIQPVKPRVKLYFGVGKRGVLYVHMQCYGFFQTHIWDRLPQLIQGK